MPPLMEHRPLAAANMEAMRSCNSTLLDSLMTSDRSCSLSNCPFIIARLLYTSVYSHARDADSPAILLSASQEGVSTGTCFWALTFLPCVLVHGPDLLRSGTNGLSTMLFSTCTRHLALCPAVPLSSSSCFGRRPRLVAPVSRSKSSSSANDTIRWRGSPPTPVWFLAPFGRPRFFCFGLACGIISGCCSGLTTRLRSFAFLESKSIMTPS
mmetsp:Transcript_6333/g.17505  ORF Transcript_6333/g.17505 Transcript_6333/m.17505 type:complete len:211 (-) Transcript_6333:371-1003(-)